MGKVNVVEFNHDASVLASGVFPAPSPTPAEGPQTHSPLPRLVRLHRPTVGPPVRRSALALAARFDTALRTGPGTSSQNRAPIQVLGEARDAVQTLHVGAGTILAGSVDGHVRTYDLRQGELRADFIGRTSALRFAFPMLTLSGADPVTAVLPTQDAQTYLVTTLDARVRLMDGASGKLLNEFKGHANEAYRCRAVFGHGEASVVCGDEGGAVWAWDLLDVRGPSSSLLGPARTVPDVDGPRVFVCRRPCCSRTRRRGCTTRSSLGRSTIRRTLGR